VKAIVYASGIGIGAAAITLIYSSTRTFNFAHASMVTWGFYMVFTFTTLFGGLPEYYLIFAGLFSSLLGVLIYYGVNIWLLKRGASEVTLMMSTLGVDLIIFGFLNVYIDFLAGYVRGLGLAGVNPKYFILETKDLIVPYLGIRLSGIVAPAILVLGVVLLHLFLTKTKIGIAMRASIENPPLAAISGINIYTIYLLAWIIGGFLAGLSGGILSLIFTGYNTVGMTLIVSFFAGAIVGGLYSIFGSLLGGLLIGLGEYMGIYLLSMYLGGWVTVYRPVIPLAIMVATLLIQPMGLAAIDWGKILRRVGLVRR
jgi:branched-chain amino acid transport system permease protein